MRRNAFLLAGVLAAAGLVPAAPAAAAKPTHVAIVIAGHGVACVSWHSGITGDDVLNTVATVKYRPTDGLITQIDGQPKNNRADATHYWSYWHNTGSGWTYSTSGASAYQPKAGSVEGWHFISGSSTATPPPVRTYASICHDTAVAPPATTSAAPRSTTVAHASAAPRSSTAVATHSSAGTAGRSPASAGAPTAGVPLSSHGSVSSTAAAVAGPASALPTLRARNTADATHHHDDGSALPTVLVLAFVLLLGGGVFFFAQRRRRSA